MLEVISSLTGSIRSSTRDLIVTLVLFGIIGLFALTTYGALLYATGLAISARSGPLVASLCLAGITAAAALIVLAILWMRRARHRRLRRLRSRSTVAAGTTAAVAAVVPALVRASPVGSLLAVAVLAYVVSRAGPGQRHD